MKYIENRSEKTRARVEEAERMRRYSIDVHSDFLEIMRSVGGVLTYDQAANIIQNIDERAVQSKAFAPSRYLMSEFKSGIVTSDIENGIIYLGRKTNAKAFDPTILWALNYIFRQCKSVDDYMSIDVLAGGAGKNIQYCVDGEYCRLYFASSLTIQDTARRILQNEELLYRSAGNIDSIRPLYVIFLTDTDKAKIELSLERLDGIGLQVSHKVVSVFGGWRDLKPEYTEYTISAEEE